MIEEGPIPTGHFSEWLTDSIELIVTGAEVEVPCGSCNACCRSGLILPVFAEETKALAHIPEEHFLEAPFLAEGVQFIDFGEDGCCPMLIEGKCSIYPNRPHACRAYDCRVLTAAGITFPEESDLSDRVLAWEFDFPSREDREMHEAVKSAADFLQECADYIPQHLIGDTPRQLAIRAILVHELFIQEDQRNWHSFDEAGTQGLAQAVISKLEQVETKQIVVKGRKSDR